MPYIDKRNRELYNFKLPIAFSGDLNFTITNIIHQYVNQHGLCYRTLNEVMGVLESAKQEFYRTVIAPYEDKKRKENGSVSELDKEKL